MSKVFRLILTIIVVSLTSAAGCGGGGGGGTPATPAVDTTSPVLSAIKPQSGESVSEADFCHVSVGAQVVQISYSDENLMDFSTFSATITSVGAATGEKIKDITALFSKIDETTIKENSDFGELCSCVLPEEDRLFCFNNNTDTFNMKIDVSIKDAAGNTGTTSISFVVSPTSPPEI